MYIPLFYCSKILISISGQKDCITISKCWMVPHLSFVISHLSKVEKIWEDSLDLISSSSPLVKIQIWAGSFLRCKGKTLLGVVNKLLRTRILLTSPINVLPHYLKQNFPPIIWIFTQGEEDEIESKLSSYIFSTLI